MVTKYKLKEDYLSYKEGTEFVEFYGNTFGILSEDEAFLGEKCVALCQEGRKVPFVVIPFSKLETINMLTDLEIKVVQLEADC